MQIFATSLNGEQTALPKLVQAELAMDWVTPCDALSASFAVEAEPEEFVTVRAVGRDGRILFQGPVDEQRFTIGPQGRLLQIAARSMAAYLTDNDALPQNYQNPSMKDLYDRHAQPYGITCPAAQTAPCGRNYTVAAGQSEWQALEGFFTGVLDLWPRVLPDGSLCWEYTNAPAVSLGNAAAGEYRYTGAERVIRRCEAYSSVLLVPAQGGQPPDQVTSTLATARGIRRRTTVTDAGNTAEAEQKALRILKRGERLLDAVELTCANGLPALPGDAAVLHDYTLGYQEGMVVSAIRYRCSGEGESCAITLILPA